MIPILFNAEATTFLSNGIGRLTEATRAIVTEERNGIFELELDYPVTGKYYSSITKKTIIYVTHDDSGDPQPFRVYANSIPINGIVTFYAHHISYDLSKIITAPFTATSCNGALQAMKTNAANACPFTFYTDKSTQGPFELTEPRSIKALLGGEEGSVLDIYGKGEYEWDGFTVKLHLNRGQDTDVVIRYGKNMTDLKYETDESETYNGVAPFWIGSPAEDESEDETTETTEENTGDDEEIVDDTVIVTLPEIIVKADNAGSPSTYLGVEAVPMDLSDQFQEPPTEEELRVRAKELLEASEPWEETNNIEINFVQLWQTTQYSDVAPLQQVKLCDTVNVIAPKHGINALRMKVVKTEYDVLRNRYSKMELGNPKTSFAQIVVADTAEAEKALEEKLDGVRVVKVEIEYCLSTSRTELIQVGDWQTTPPTFQAGYFYWERTATYFSNNTVKHSPPKFSQSAQLAAETAQALASTNNHFWHDNTGAYVTEQDGSYATGYATRITNSGILQSFNNKLMSSWTNSGVVFYKSDGQTPMASFGAAGISFDDQIPFTIGNSNSFVKWYNDNGVWRIRICADSIEMGGREVMTDGDAGKWYTGTSITGTSTTPTIFSGSGISDAKIGDMYLNTSTSNTYRCTTGGAPSVAKWAYSSNIKGQNGQNGQDGRDGVDITSQYMEFSSTNGLRVYSGYKGSATYNKAFVQVKGTEISFYRNNNDNSEQVASFSDTVSLGSGGLFKIYPDANIHAYFETSLNQFTFNKGALLPNLTTYSGTNGVDGELWTYGKFYYKGMTSTSSSANARLGTSTDHYGQLYYSTGSARRYKEDIDDIKDDSLNPEKLYNLRVAQFRYKDGYLLDDDERFGQLLPGFIAEEVLEAYPIAADTEGDEVLDWNFRYLVPPMLKLIQEQKKKLDYLEEEIQKMKGVA